jgi:hypothetical protein
LTVIVQHCRCLKGLSKDTFQKLIVGAGDVKFGVACAFVVLLLGLLVLAHKSPALDCYSTDDQNNQGHTQDYVQRIGWFLRNALTILGGTQARLAVRIFSAPFQIAPVSPRLCDASLRLALRHVLTPTGACSTCDIEVNLSIGRCADAVLALALPAALTWLVVAQFEA